MFIIIWICLGIVGAMISSGKGNSGCFGFILGIVLGPIGLLIAFFSSDNQNAKNIRNGDTKKCPYCAEFVKPAALICKHCGRDLNKSNFNIDDFRK
ncbi:zinc ribbon domain-containing protein [Lacihabitans sp. CCS-44]|uniref:zinc ribbon domain-containing protein n=1 Tax=Lacihabitans sp. CCS-44 TaxID=2487331 RepID=UPI0020CBBCC6|nr:zinc ribbon domain-containing protein [Lacihabitans sp. CCS-44]MCP9755114.1 zinc ribbon domain-containing protein [Lacihabitans sp. CCS-44]